MNLVVDSELQLVSADRKRTGMYKVVRVTPKAVKLELLAGMPVVAVGKPVPKSKLAQHIWVP